MNFFTKLSHNIRKGHLVAVAVLAIVGVGGGLVQAEFYPNRPTYDYNKSGNGNCSDPTNPAVDFGRCGSMDGPVFNSFINTPSYGDERAFLDARRTDQTASGSYKNVLSDVTQGSREVIVRMYVHNNANGTTNASGEGVAKDTKVRIDLPEATASSLRTRGYISASNATPQLVEDTVDFTSGEAFSVAYIPGSATLVNNQGFKNGVALNDSIVTTGALIGDDALDGQLPGCFEYEAIVQIRVKVTPKQNPAIEFKKEVNKAGVDGWKEEVSVKPGDKIKWLITFKNTGPVDLTNVRISDKLPPHVQLVPGTVRYIDANQDVVQGDAPLFGTGGINYNKWSPNGGFYVRFETTAKSDFEGCSVFIRNIAYNNTDQTSQLEDTADVRIVKENCVPPVTPKYACDLLTVKPLGDRKYELKTNFTATGGATFKQVSYAITSNGQTIAPFVTTNATNAVFTLPADGTYVFRATPQFTVDGKVVSAADNDKCAASVSLAGVTPVKTTPVALPNTGVESLIGLFAIVTLIGAGAHRFWFARRV